MMRRFGSLCVMILLAMVLSACPGLASESITVGAIFSLSGIAATHNGPLIPMLELAVEEVNQGGGLHGRPVKLVFLDNQSTPIGSVKAAEEAVRLGMTAVIGAHWSSHSLAMAPVLQKAGIPMISPGSTHPMVTRVGDYIFRTCFVDSFQGRAMARFAFKELGARRVAVAKNIDEDYSAMLADCFSESFQLYGGKVACEVQYRGKAVDFSDIMEQIKRARPDVVYVPGYTRDSGLLIRQGVSMGIRATFLGGDAWDEISVYAGDAVEGSYQSAPWHPSVPRAESLRLKELYFRKYGAEIKSFSAPLAYDAVMLLVDAIRRAGTSDRARIRDCLAGTLDFRGATGLINYHGGGDPIDKEIVMLKWEKGSPRYYQTIKPE